MEIREISQTVSPSHSVSKQKTVHPEPVEGSFMVRQAHHERFRSPIYDTLYDSSQSGANRTRIIRPPWSAS